MSEHDMVEEDVDETSSSAEDEQALQAAEAAVQDDLAVLTAERDEMRALAQRLQADFENYKKRMLREQTNAIEHANARLLEQLLPALESFELAAKSIESAGASAGADVEALRGGVLAAIRQLEDVVAKAGLEPIDATGQPFDPNEHEAVMQDDGDGEPVVAQVLRTGYRLKGRVLRPAMVRVTRNHVDAQA
jgi:molecular chaperone GrpE